MRAIVLASTALALSLSACKVDAPQGFGDPVLALATLSPKQCRDKDTGRFAKCQTCPDGSRIAVSDECPIIVTPPPEPDPTPVPEPTPTGWEPSPSLDGLVPIASEFDPFPLLGTAPLALSAAPDVVGAFRFVCDAGQILADDPIVYPGQPGKSHLHQFYGNTGANAYSTYKSLRTSGQSTCGKAPLNRSAYWMPAMLDGKGNVIRPDHIQIYYKRRPKSDPIVSAAPGTPVTPLKSTDQKYAEGFAVDTPNGLKFIFGFDMVTLKAPTGAIYFQCVASGITQVHEANLEGASILACPVGGRVVATIKAPDCWTGKDLDSPNHRDHVAYKQRDPNYGFLRCPSTHPYVIPGFTLTASYLILEGDDPKLWSFSSDAMHPELPRGSTYHTDFDMAWDPTIRRMWHDNCIDKMLNCSDGDMGNGRKMNSALTNDAHLVPLSSI